MKNENIENALTDIDEKYIAEALENEEAARPKSRARVIVLRALIAAAAAALIAALGIGVWSAAEEYKEYKEYKTALTFFSEHELETAGLSREELKAVYKDIENGTFILEKTREVLLKRLDVAALAGFEAGQGAVSPEQLTSLWKIVETPGVFSAFAAGDGYEFDLLEETNGSVLRRYKDGNLIFETEIADFDITGAVPLADGSLLYGSPTNRQVGSVAKVDAAGNLLWEKTRTGKGLQFEYFAAAFERADGKYAFIGTGRKIDAPEHEHTLSYCVYDANGDEALYTETTLPGVSPVVKNAIACKDGYIVQISRSPEKNENSIVRVNALGEITETFTYPDDGKDYFIGGVCEIDGKLTLAVTAIERPRYASVYFKDLRMALDDLLAKRALDKITEPPTSRELTEHFCASISALILTCDKESGKIGIANSFSGAIACGFTQENRIKLCVPTNIVYLPGTYCRYAGAGNTCEPDPFDRAAPQTADGKAPLKWN